MSKLILLAFLVFVAVQTKSFRQSQIVTPVPANTSPISAKPGVAETLFRRMQPATPTSVPVPGPVVVPLPGPTLATAPTPVPQAVPAAPPANFEQFGRRNRHHNETTKPLNNTNSTIPVYVNNTNSSQSINSTNASHPITSIQDFGRRSRNQSQFNQTFPAYSNTSFPNASFPNASYPVNYTNASYPVNYTNASYPSRPVNYSFAMYPIISSNVTVNQTAAKTLPGGWKKVNATTFNSSNSNVANEAVQAVNLKFDPEADGYEFTRIVSVDEQVVAGINYAVVLEYQNAVGDSEFYEVIIYSAPWNGPDQVVAVKPLEQTTESVQTGGWKPVNATVFATTNNFVFQAAINSVNSQFNPEADGFEFNRIDVVLQQVVAGMNYDIVLQYSNADGESRYYDVIIYSVPWTGTNQVVSTRQVKAPALVQ